MTAAYGSGFTINVKKITSIQIVDWIVILSSLLYRLVGLSRSERVSSLDPFKNIPALQSSENGAQFQYRRWWCHPGPEHQHNSRVISILLPKITARCMSRFVVWTLPWRRHKWPTLMEYRLICFIYYHKVHHFFQLKLNVESTDIQIKAKTKAN